MTARSLAPGDCGASTSGSRGDGRWQRNHPNGGEHREGDSPSVPSVGLPAGTRGLHLTVLDSESGERFATPTDFTGHALYDPLGREIEKV